MRLRLSYSLLVRLPEIVFPGLFLGDLGISVKGLASGKIIDFIAPPVLDGFELIEQDGPSLRIALISRRIRVLIKPNGVGVKMVTSILNRGPFGEEQKIRLDAGIGREHTFG